MVMSASTTIRFTWSQRGPRDERARLATANCHPVLLGELIHGRAAVNARERVAATMGPNTRAHPIRRVRGAWYG